LELISGGYLPEVWAYPPNLWLPTVSLAAFSLDTAWAAWLGFQVLALVLASAALAFCLPAYRLTNGSGKIILVPKITFFALHLSLMVASEANSLRVSGGQLSQFLLLAAAMIVVGFVRGKNWPVVAGLVLFFMKPHIGAPIAIGLAIAGPRGRRAVAMAAAVSTLLMLPALLRSPTALFDWLRTLRDYAGANTSNLPDAMTGLRNLSSLLGDRAIDNFSASFLAIAAAAAVALWLRRNESLGSRHDVYRFAVQAVASMLSALAVASLHIYDFLLVGAALPLLVFSTLPRYLAALLAGLMVLQPSSLFEWFNGAPSTTIFSGSTFATVGGLVFLLLLLTERSTAGTEQAHRT
jgi:hypothetical protein